MKVGDSLGGALRLALWTLLLGIDRLSLGVEALRRTSFGNARPAPHRPSPSLDPHQIHHSGRPGAPVPGAPVPGAPVQTPPNERATSGYEPPIPEHQPIPTDTRTSNFPKPEEKETMSVDQDLSGDMVKVVQYSIVSVATGILDNAVIIQDFKSVAFGDDMTAADFTSWILSKHCPSPQSIRDLAIRLCQDDQDLDPAFIEKILRNKKWHRVAFQVVSRFSPADIDWDIAQVKASGEQATQLAKIAKILENWPPNALSPFAEPIDDGEPGLEDEG